MKRSLPTLCGVLAAAAVITSPASAQAPVPSAKEIARTLATGIQDGSSRVRLKLQTPSGTVLQLQVKSRRDASATALVYQVLWPKERKGEGFLLGKSGGRATSGTLLAPPAAPKSLSSSDLRGGIFGSDLSYEDLVENFYTWSDQSIIGSEAVNQVPCQVLESKPGGAASPYSKVQSWIDLKRMVPLRVDKYGKSGKLERRVMTTRVAKDDKGREIPASFSVQGPALGAPTIIEGSNSTHDVNYTDADFTPEAIGRLK